MGKLGRKIQVVKSLNEYMNYHVFAEVIVKLEAEKLFMSWINIS